MQTAIIAPERIAVARIALGFGDKPSCIVSSALRVILSIVKFNNRIALVVDEKATINAKWIASSHATVVAKVLLGNGRRAHHIKMERTTRAMTNPTLNKAKAQHMRPTSPRVPLSKGNELKKSDKLQGKYLKIVV